MSAATAGQELVHLLTLRLSNLCDAPSGAGRGTTDAADVTCGACLGKIAARMPECCASGECEGP